jgi:hypothetical protein
MSGATNKIIVSSIATPSFVAAVKIAKTVLAKPTLPDQVIRLDRMLPCRVRNNTKRLFD